MEVHFLAALKMALAVTILLHATTSCRASQILFVTFYGSKSDVAALVPAMEALNARGHNITYLTVYEPDSPFASRINVLPLEKVKNFVATHQINFFSEYNFASPMAVAKWLHHMGVGTCAALMRDPNFKMLVANNRTSSKFDAVVMDPNFSECALSLVWLLGSPHLIYYSTTALYSWTAMALDIPSPFSYVPLHFTPFIDEMNFSERFVNTFATIAFLAYRNYYLIPKAESIIRKDHPTTPALLDLARNASFVFANSHSPSVDLSRPLAPFFAEVGGIQCRPARPLTKNLEEFIAAAGNQGFVYFSLSTHFKAADMGPKKIRLFLNAFGRLKQRVVWKLEDVDLQHVPSNVWLTNSVSQQDLLGHPKIKLFITQGGQLNVHEAVYHAVPLLGLPILAEHFSTFKNYKRNGMAEMLDYTSLNEDTIYESILRVINDPRYKENCLTYSELFRDRPLEPLYEVVYWIEYVIRHDGGRHLRFDTEHLNFFQYFLLDIIGLILLVLIVVLCASVKIIKITFGLLRRAYRWKNSSGPRHTRPKVQYKKLK